MTWVILLLFVAFLVANSNKPESAWAWAGAAALVFAFRSWKRGRSYPAGRSKAHGATKELLRRAQAKERELLLDLETEVLPDGSTREWPKWERVTADAGLPGSTLQRIEAIPTGFLLQVELRSGGTLEQAQGAKGALESALKLRRGAIELEQDEEHHAGVILLRVTPERTVTAQPIPWPGPVPKASILDPVQLGVYQGGGPLEALLAYVHFLIAGATDAGKSGVLNILVGQLAACQDVQLRGIDLKDGVELGPWEPAMVEVVRNVAQAEALLEREQQEMNRRYALMAARKQRKWRPTPDEPARVTVIDEQRVLGGSKRAVALQEDITGRGRAAMVTLGISTLYPTVEAMGSNQIANNCNLRICLRVLSSTENNVVLGKGMAGQGWEANKIPPGAPGTLYLYGAGATVPRLARAFYASDDKVEQVARKLARVGAPRPGLAAAASPPAGAAPPDNTNPDEEDGSGGGEDDVLAILQESPEPLRFSEVVIRSTASRATVARRLNAHRDADPPLVEQLGDGRWRAVS